MKIKVNYDVIDKIDIMNKGYNLNQNFRIIAVSVSAAILFDITKNKIDLKGMIASLAYGLMMIPFLNLFDKLIGDKKEYAKEQLTEFTGKLKNIHVYTNTDLLQEAELIKTDYKFVRQEDGLFALKEDKYIKVPVEKYFDNQKQKIIHQEHIVGKKDYDVSVGEPSSKKKQFTLKRKMVHQM